MSGLVGGIITILLVVLGMTVHQVDEGYRGVYWTGGRMHKSMTKPGYHLKLPITEFHQVQISLQTDRVRSIPCGTSGGVVVTFDSIEVVNQLEEDKLIPVIQEYGVDYDQLWIFDKIHHEINQFCSSHSLREVYIELFDTLDESLTNALQIDVDKYAPGINIIAARVTKPIIPETIRENYERMEAERTELLIASERQKVVEKMAETERLMATIVAEKLANVSSVNMEKKLIEKQAYQKIKAIEDANHIRHQKAMADANLYMQQQKAQANSLKLTTQYLQKQTYDILKGTPKVYFTSKISDVLNDAPKQKMRRS